MVFPFQYSGISKGKGSKWNFTFGCGCDNGVLKTEDDYVALFDWLNSRKEIDQKAFLRYPAFGLKKEINNYRWNYVEDKFYPCNETRHAILSRLEKAGIGIDFLSDEKKQPCGISYIL